MKKVQIDYELFRKLIFYHLGSDTQYADMNSIRSIRLLLLRKSRRKHDRNI